MEIEKDTYTSKYYILLTNFAMNVYGPKEGGGGEMVRVGQGWGGVKGRRRRGKRAFNTFAFAICKTHFGESSSVHHSTKLSTEFRNVFSKTQSILQTDIITTVFLKKKNVDFSSSPRPHLICKSVYERNATLLVRILHTSKHSLRAVCIIGIDLFFSSSSSFHLLLCFRVHLQMGGKRERLTRFAILAK